MLAPFLDAPTIWSSSTAAVHPSSTNFLKTAEILLSPLKGINDKSLLL